MELEKGKNLDYWNDITILVEDELQKLRKFERQSEFEGTFVFMSYLNRLLNLFYSILFMCFTVGRRDGINSSVTADVVSIFRGKSVSQLDALRKQIESKIASGEKGVDVGYWESLLSQLKGIFSFSVHVII